MSHANKLHIKSITEKAGKGGENTESGHKNHWIDETKVNSKESRLIQSWYYIAAY